MLKLSKVDQKLKFIFLYLFFAHSVYAQVSSTQSDSQGNTLSDFFKLTQQLPQAVCDETVVSRAPTLETLNSEGESQKNHSLVLSISETRVIEFLMEDETSFVASPGLIDDWRKLPTQSAEDLAAFKKKTALDLCTAIITPGQFDVLTQDKPELLLRLNQKINLNKKNHIRLQDIEGRFGFINSQWVVAGWIEPYEVQSIKIGNRTYRRLSNYITNQLHFIQVIGQGGVPLGYLYPSEKKPNLNWSYLQETSKKTLHQKKLFENYRKMIEIQAYEALALFPEKVETIRKLQEFYKNLLNAYHLYPESDQFKHYKNKKINITQKKQVKKVLNQDFFNAIESAKVNQSYVGMVYFEPDKKLHAIFNEYKNKLLQLKN